jgi:hypothetical protein
MSYLSTRPVALNTAAAVKSLLKHKQLELYDKSIGLLDT